MLSNLGACYSALGEPERAEQLHRRALACDPEDLGVRWNLFSNLVCRGQLARALEVLDATAKLPQLEPEERENLWAYRGQLLLQLGRLDEALAAMDASLVTDRSEPNRQFTRAQILVALGRTEHARLALLDVLARCPTSRSAQELLERICAGRRGLLN